MTPQRKQDEERIVRPAGFTPNLASMDVPRVGVAAKKRKRRIIIIAACALGLILATIAISRLKPAVPSVDRSTVWIDTVKRGPMVRQVRGLGTLVPEDIRWIPANTEGRVEKINIWPGTRVEPDSVILELTSPEVEQAAHDAELQATAAEAELTTLRATLQRSLLDQEATTAKAKSDYEQAKMERETNDQLAKNGLIAELQYKTSKVKEAELVNRNEIEEKRLKFAHDSIDPQLASRQAAVDQAKQLAKLRADQVEALHVRAGMSGVLQQLPVQIGQRMKVGDNLARVADPTKLKAQVKIAETQAKDIQVGQKAVIDTRNGTANGHVTRVDPAVEQGTVNVEVAFDEPLPKGARPDLSVDGTIELEHLDNIVYVGRPAFGQENNTVGMFKLITGTSEAVRTPVKLGKSSVNTIEIVSGLQPGDQVILSDTSAWDAHERIRLN
ncbi:MAG TPA: HlyD family efflux transporter periplasmic adaptor subunit [Candidatus Limnocylindria bacterium]|nr:HlyD family efflux transporter periplasmic adaptor subunit [Candidatus Limnocylindria bacterium]